MPVRRAASGRACRCVDLAIAAVVVLLLYGSWLPLTFRLEHVHGAFWTQLHFSSLRAADTVTNFVIYLPLGLLVAMRLARAAGGLNLRLTAATLAGTLTSLLAEAGQTLLPMRDPSWTDVLINIGGTLAGALLAGPSTHWAARVSVTLKRSLRRCPMRALLWIACALVAFAQLAPFDVALSSADLSASLRDARWSFTEQAPGSGRATSVQNLTATAGDFFAFVLLGVLAALAQREAGASRSASAAVAMARLAFGALVLEVAQLLLRSHVCDLADIITCAAGAALGTVLGATAVDRCWRRPGLPGLQNPALRCLLVLALVVQAALIAACALPTEGGWVSPSADAIQWLPFYAHFKEPFAVSVDHLLTSTMWYLTLATLAVAALPRVSATYSLAMSTLLTVGLVTLAEILQAFSLARCADVTEPLLAAVAALLATLMFYRLRSWQAGQPTSEHQSMSS